MVAPQRFGHRDLSVQCGSLQTKDLDSMICTVVLAYGYHRSATDGFLRTWNDRTAGMTGIRFHCMFYTVLHFLYFRSEQLAVQLALLQVGRRV